jgi:branched-chain amino acid transport system ATP-binding protein
MSVADNLLMAMEWRGGGGGILADIVALPTRRRLESRRRERVAEVAELCGLTDMLNSVAGSLPIGLARQVELGRAVIDHPRTLLLDEPTSGLAQSEAERLGRMIVTLASKEEVAIVIVEHNVGFVLQHSERVTALSLGRVIGEGSPSEIQENSDVQNAYFR